MILHGNQRGGAKDLALHLLKDENDRVDIHDMRGFVADDLVCAFKEIEAISRATKARQYLYSLSLNPPPDARVSTADFEAAIARTEKELGLEGQPRAIVFHHKNGRRHCHAVWSRIDAKDMKAIHLPFTKRRLMEISRELYIEHGWTMPAGSVQAQDRDPNNFTLKEWQQAKRTSQDPKAIKQALRECWAISDNRTALEQALKSKGFMLAKGDRRGFVVLDQYCEVYAFPKWAGLKTKQVREKIGAGKDLPSVAETKQQIAQLMTERLRILGQARNQAIRERLDQIEAKRCKMNAQHKRDYLALEQAQQERWCKEVQARQARYSKGLRGLLNWFSGAHSKIKRQNELETLQAFERDSKERDQLTFQQLEQRRELQQRLNRLDRYQNRRTSLLEDDICQYEHIQHERQERFDRQRDHGPTL